MAAATRKLEGLGEREAAHEAAKAQVAERSARLDLEQVQLEAAKAALQQEQLHLQTATKVPPPPLPVVVLSHSIPSVGNQCVCSSVYQEIMLIAILLNILFSPLMFELYFPTKDPKATWCQTAYLQNGRSRPCILNFTPQGRRLSLLGAMCTVFF